MSEATTIAELLRQGNNAADAIGAPERRTMSRGSPDSCSTCAPAGTSGSVRVLSMNTGFRYGQLLKPSTTSKVLRPMTMASTLAMNSS